MNQLYYGDNLQVLREHIADESVDLIYLDPNKKKYPRVQLLTIEGLLSKKQRAEHPDYEPTTEKIVARKLDNSPEL
jgi:hypothetical protein